MTTVHAYTGDQRLVVEPVPPRADEEVAALLVLRLAVLLLQLEDAGMTGKDRDAVPEGLRALGMRDQGRDAVAVELRGQIEGALAGALAGAVGLDQADDLPGELVGVRRAGGRAAAAVGWSPGAQSRSSRTPG